jgi:hypothetical protein
MTTGKRALCGFIRSDMTPKCFAVVVLSLALFLPLGNGVLAQVDITEKVRSNTPLPQTIKDFCATYCQGNKREGHLRSVTVRPIGNGRYRGSMTADLRNWQEMDAPFNMTVFDWTVRVRTEALLDASTCIVVIDSVSVDNDPSGLLSGVLGDPKGRKVQVSNCKRLLP